MVSITTFEFVNSENEIKYVIYGLIWKVNIRDVLCLGSPISIIYQKNSPRSFIKFKNMYHSVEKDVTEFIHNKIFHSPLDWSFTLGKNTVDHLIRFVDVPELFLTPIPLQVEFIKFATQNNPFQGYSISGDLRFSIQPISIDFRSPNSIYFKMVKIVGIYTIELHDMCFILPITLTEFSYLIELKNNNLVLNFGNNTISYEEMHTSLDPKAFNGFKNISNNWYYQLSNTSSFPQLSQYTCYNSIIKTFIDYLKIPMYICAEYTEGSRTHYLSPFNGKRVITKYKTPIADNPPVHSEYYNL